MQTIRIYRRTGGFVASFRYIKGDEHRKSDYTRALDTMPEGGQFIWLR